jgi:hypothetical protein
MESKDYLRKLLTASSRVYGKVNRRGDDGAHLSVYVVDTGSINDITALVARCTTRVLCPKGLYVNGVGHCHIQAISEELASLFNMHVSYEQLPSNYS